MTMHCGYIAIVYHSLDLILGHTYIRVESLCTKRYKEGVDDHRDTENCFEAGDQLEESSKLIRVLQVDQHINALKEHAQYQVLLGGTRQLSWGLQSEGNRTDHTVDIKFSVRQAQVSCSLLASHRLLKHIFVT